MTRSIVIGGDDRCEGIEIGRGSTPADRNGLMNLQFHAFLQFVGDAKQIQVGRDDDATFMVQQTPFADDIGEVIDFILPIIRDVKAGFLPFLRLVIDALVGVPENKRRVWRCLENCDRPSTLTHFSP